MRNETFNEIWLFCKAISMTDILGISSEQWNELKAINLFTYFLFRESDNEQTFLQGIRTCIADDFHDGPGGNLVQNLITTFAKS